MCEQGRRKGKITDFKWFSSVMFGLLNNLAHHCGVASFPPCWAAIPGTIDPPCGCRAQLCPWRTFRRPLLSSINSRTHSEKKKDEEKKEELLLLMVKDSGKALSVMWKKQERERWKWIRSAHFFLVFSPLCISCVFPLCCRQTALTNLWAWMLHPLTPTKIEFKLYKRYSKYSKGPSNPGE